MFKGILKLFLVASYGHRDSKAQKCPSVAGILGNMVIKNAQVPPKEFWRFSLLRFISIVLAFVYGAWLSVPRSNGSGLHRWQSEMAKTPQLEITFCDIKSISAYCYYRLTEERGQHREGGKGEVMLSTQPFCDLTWTLTDRTGKLGL